MIFGYLTTSTRAVRKETLDESNFIQIMTCIISEQRTHSIKEGKAHPKRSRGYNIHHTSLKQRDTHHRKLRAAASF